MTWNTILSGIAVAAFAASVSCSATPAAAQSFDCGAAALSSEKAVCASARLSGLDERMSSLYDKLMTSLERDDQREGLRDYQMRFLATRNGCGRNAGCITGAYLDQIDVLRMRIRYVEARWDQ